MHPTLRVSSPPARPLMVYDGDCGFCTMWIRRWQHSTGERVDYLPAQDPQIALRFPDIPRERFEEAVQLIQPDGAVFAGAEAVLRALALSPQAEWLFDMYQHWTAFARVSEWGYRFVARNRSAFSLLTRWLWGRSVEPPSHALVRWTFLRYLGIIYLVAFWSLAGQIRGLIGSDGIFPVKQTIAALKQDAAAAGIGLNRFHLVPTLCWFDSSDKGLRVQCAAGAGLAMALVLDIAPAPCLFLLWLIYLSLTSAGGVFMGFQWDNLLLETGFLAIFFAPFRFSPHRPSREPAPSRWLLWLLRWLLFRLMFESGCVKLLSGDPAWRNLTALRYHFETQPLPTWVAWYAHQLPLWIQKDDAAIMFAIELGMPFLIFAPRRPRLLAAASFAALQGFILITGNYGFFNLLALLLCLTLMDDAALKSIPAGIGARIKAAARRRTAFWFDAGTNPQENRPAPARSSRWPGRAAVSLVAVTLCVSIVQCLVLFHVPTPGPRPVLVLFDWLAPFRSFNIYGLFSVMTTSRREIIVQGSADGVSWLDYEFKYKPGNPNRRPQFVEPHQPRLDWQMWFAALGNYRQNPWFVQFCARLLDGSPDVLVLLEHNPFPEAPPRYIRALVYEYHFTTPELRRSTGAWWRRELIGIYLPPLTLRVGAGLDTTRPRHSPYPTEWAGAAEAPPGITAQRRR